MNVSCVLDMKKIQCVFFKDLAEIYALSINEIAQKAAQERPCYSVCSKILGITEEELPVCLQKMISLIC
uniref:Uncharacterized protein n=1 Tax=Acrobeloides nanus TaxID=290746 RepID=A0A914CUB6_9BILA